MIGLWLTLHVLAAPEPELPPTVDSEDWRAKPPGPGPEVAWSPPVPTVVHLANGIPVYVLESPGLPLLSVRLVLNVGREANPVGKAGLAELTANLLEEGTTTLSGEELSARSQAVGAALEVYATEETAVVSLDALTGDSLAPSLDLLADVALHPRFDRRVFDRVRRETVAEVQAWRAEPDIVAEQVLARQVFGLTHPYGSLSVGEVLSLRSLRVADVRGFYRTWWHAGNAAFVVSGATTAAEVESLLGARFGGWARGATVRPNPPPPSVPLQTRVVFVEQPGAVQSVLSVATPGVARGAPEYVAADLAGTMVGGMFSSPLNMNLREEHGWSYGAYAEFTQRRDHGLFVVDTQVQADKTAPAVAEVLRELTIGMTGPPVTEQMKLAKEYLLKSLPGAFETNADAVWSLARIPQFGLAPDAWRRRSEALVAVEAAQVAKQAARYFDPQRMIVVVVGPKEVEGEDGVKVDVLSALRALGYELVIVDAP